MKRRDTLARLDEAVRWPVEKYGTAQVAGGPLYVTEMNRRWRAYRRALRALLREELRQYVHESGDENLSEALDGWQRNLDANERMLPAETQRRLEHERDEARELVRRLYGETRALLDDPGMVAVMHVYTAEAKLREWGTDAG